jgi:hypothetical protein
MAPADFPFARLGFWGLLDFRGLPDRAAGAALGREAESGFGRDADVDLGLDVPGCFGVRDFGGLRSSVAMRPLGSLGAD